MTKTEREEILKQLEEYDSKYKEYMKMYRDVYGSQKITSENMDKQKRYFAKAQEYRKKYNQLIKKV